MFNTVEQELTLVEADIMFVRLWQLWCGLTRLAQPYTLGPVRFLSEITSSQIKNTHCTLAVVFKLFCCRTCSNCTLLL